jgi:hypothetical protein
MLKKIWEHSLLSFSLASILTLCILVGGVFLSIGSRWNGYYLVLLHKESDINNILSELQSAGFKDIVCSLNAEVVFNDFSELKRVNAGKVAERLQPEDPRFDEFLEKVPRLFESSSGEEQLLFFPVRWHPFLFYLRIATHLSGQEWSFVDWEPRKAIGLFILFAAFVGSTVLFRKNRRLERGLLAIPWVLPVLQGNLLGFCVSLLIYHASVEFLEGYIAEFEQFLQYGKSARTRNSLFPLGVIYLLLIAILAILGNGKELLILLFYGSIGTIGVTAVLILYRILQVKARLHRVFIPLPILPLHWKGSKQGLILFSGVLILAIAPLFDLLLPSQIQTTIPVPHASWSGSVLTRTDLRDLWMLHRKDPIPNLADYLVHVKFQDGFLFGASYNFPSSDETLLYPRFQEKEGNLVYWNETLAKYDHVWYKNMLKRAKSDILGNLLYQQGAKPIVLEPLSNRMTGEQLILYCILLCLSLVRAFFRLKNPWGEMISPRTQAHFIRRKQQEA